MKRITLFCAVAGCVFVADLLSLGGLPEGRWAHPPSAEAPAAGRAPVTPSRTSTSRKKWIGKTPRRSGRSWGADSTRRRVTAGETLFVTLPSAVDGQAVASYEMLRAPAMSDLAGRSFFWRTRPRDEGRHRLLFRARLDSTARAPAAVDTLAMVVTVRAPN